jgi:SAM-dependent methyltransferase
MWNETQIPVKPKYILDDNNSEISRCVPDSCHLIVLTLRRRSVNRLKNQYHFFKTVFDYPDIIPPAVNVSRLRKVIDVATGTGAWALDFVSRPDVRDRGVQVFACDISTAKFPQADKPDANKITFFQHDVTKPFPDEMLGTFDLVNMTYLGFALTAPGWKLALKNLRRLLSEQPLSTGTELRTYNRAW